MTSTLFKSAHAAITISLLLISLSILTTETDHDLTCCLEEMDRQRQERLERLEQLELKYQEDAHQQQAQHPTRLEKVVYNNASSMLYKLACCAATVIRG
jgi:ERCC4-type nuclease